MNKTTTFWISGYLSTLFFTACVPPSGGSSPSRFDLALTSPSPTPTASPTPTPTSGIVTYSNPDPLTGLYNSGRLVLSSNNLSHLYSMAIDEESNQGFVSTAAPNATGLYPIVKIDLGTGGATPVELTHINLNPAEICRTMVFAPTSRLLYAGTLQRRFIQFQPGGTQGSFKILSAITLNAGEIPEGLVIDEVQNFAYVGTSNGQIVMIDLNSPTPTRIGAISLGVPGSQVSALAVDASYIYAATYGGKTDYVLKALKGKGPTLPTLVGSLALPAHLNHIGIAYFDVGNLVAYVGTYNSDLLDTYFGPGPAFLATISLGMGNMLPQVAGMIPTNFGFMTTMVPLADAKTGKKFLLISNDETEPASSVNQFDVTRPLSPSYVGSIFLPIGSETTYPIMRLDPASAGTHYVRSAGVNSLTGCLFEGTDQFPGAISKVCHQ